MKSGHEIHEMPDPCTSCQYYPDGAFDMWLAPSPEYMISGDYSPMLWGARPWALLAPGCCLLSTKYTKCSIHVLRGMEKHHVA